MVDDDVELCRMVIAFLREDGFDSRAVHRGEDALQLVADDVFDVLVLDLMMPGMSGHEVLRRLQACHEGTLPIPVLMLTARGDDVDRIIGLETGADDYLPKPCNLRELAARLRAILRRSMHSAGRGGREPKMLSVGDVTLDPGRHEATKSGQRLNLTGAEFAVLRKLMETAGRPVSKDQLTRSALGRDYMPYDRSIDVHVANLRRKMQETGPAGSPIKTIRGSGYQFVVPQGD